RGYKGTLDQWIESLRGKKGEKGEKGDQGEKGEKGESLHFFYIPDPNFRAHLQAEYPSVFFGDQLNTDNPIIKDADSLNVSKKGVASLEGIEYFPNLKTLICSENKLSQLNLSKNINLNILRCNGNELTQLNLSQNTALTILDCQHNKLEKLDLSKNPNIVKLHCERNRLQRLDLTAIRKKINEVELEIYYGNYKAEETLTSIELNKRLKDHPEIKQVKEISESCRISYYWDSGQKACNDYDPTDRKCNDH
ncbi:MAG: hypothetical protein V6Z82_06745, partial [Flavobacteriales bacterium]